MTQAVRRYRLSYAEYALYGVEMHVVLLVT